jgi:hypothetical protein
MQFNGGPSHQILTGRGPHLGHDLTTANAVIAPSHAKPNGARAHSDLQA